MSYLWHPGLGKYLFLKIFIDLQRDSVKKNQIFFWNLFYLFLFWIALRNWKWLNFGSWVNFAEKIVSKNLVALSSLKTKIKTCVSQIQQLYSNLNFIRKLIIKIIHIVTISPGEQWFFKAIYSSCYFWLKRKKGWAGQGKCQ